MEYVKLRNQCVTDSLVFEINACIHKNGIFKKWTDKYKIRI
jgi:hypothetical protein